MLKQTSHLLQKNEGLASFQWCLLPIAHNYPFCKHKPFSFTWQKRSCLKTCSYKVQFHGHTRNVYESINPPSTLNHSWSEREKRGKRKKIKTMIDGEDELKNQSFLESTKTSHVKLHKRKSWWGTAIWLWRMWISCCHTNFNWHAQE